MNYSIKTAEKFKLPIASLSRAWDLGAENVIARMAFAISIEKEEQLNLSHMLDSKGKEYPSKILFGEYQAIYEALLTEREGIPPSHPDFKRFVKSHVDRGLEELISHSGMDLAQVVDYYSTSDHF